MTLQTHPRPQGMTSNPERGPSESIDAWELRLLQHRRELHTRYHPRLPMPPAEREREQELLQRLARRAQQNAQRNERRRTRRYDHCTVTWHDHRSTRQPWHLVHFATVVEHNVRGDRTIHCRLPQGLFAGSLSFTNVFKQSRRPPGTLYTVADHDKALVCHFARVKIARDRAPPGGEQERPVRASPEPANTIQVEGPVTTPHPVSIPNPTTGTETEEETVAETPLPPTTTTSTATSTTTTTATTGLEPEPEEPTTPATPISPSAPQGVTAVVKIIAWVSAQATAVSATPPITAEVTAKHVVYEVGTGVTADDAMAAAKYQGRDTATRCAKRTAEAQAIQEVQARATIAHGLLDPPAGMQTQHEVKRVAWRIKRIVDTVDAPNPPPSISRKHARSDEHVHVDEEEGESSAPRPTKKVKRVSFNPDVQVKYIERVEKTPRVPIILMPVLGDEPEPQVEGPSSSPST